MPATPQDTFFVSTAWLAENRDAPDLAVIDGTFFLPDEKRDAKAEYLAERLRTITSRSDQQIELTYRLALGRLSPDGKQLAYVAEEVSNR